MIIKQGMSPLTNGQSDQEKTMTKQSSASIGKNIPLEAANLLSALEEQYRRTLTDEDRFYLDRARDILDMLMVKDVVEGRVC